MSRKKKYQAKDKIIHKMTRDGLMEINAATGEEIRVSKRDADFRLRPGNDPERSQIPRISDAAHNRRRTIPMQGTPNSGIKQADTPSVPPLPTVQLIPDSSKVEPPGRMEEPLSPESSVPNAAASGLVHTLRSRHGRNGKSIQEGKIGPRGNTESADRAGRDSPYSSDNPPTPSAGKQNKTAYYQKFYQKSHSQDEHEISSQDKTALPSRLQFTGEEQAPPGKKLINARQKAEHTAERLEKARQKLPKKKNRRTGKLGFEPEMKSSWEHLQGPRLLHPVRAGTDFTLGTVHGKLRQAEQENVGTEAAHKGALLTEQGVRSAYRFHKTAPYRRVARLERLSFRHNAELAYQTLLRENPNLRSNPLSRFLQKQKIKRQYAKVARESMRLADRIRNIGAAGGKAFRAVAGFVSSHPMAVSFLALLLLLMFSFSALFTSCTNMALGGLSSIVLSSYTADDKDIDNAELAYTEWETDLQLQINHAEDDHPGFDEYRYQVDDISHNPFELMAYLSAAYQDFQFSAVQSELRRIFDAQYTLEFVEETEIRYRTETSTDPVTGEESEEEVPYEWYILNINLTSRSFTEVIMPELDAEEREMYDLYMQTKGNRQYIASPFDFDWISHVTSYYGWRVHPLTGEKNYHKGIDIAVPIGTDILSGQDGTVTQASFDAGGYGWYIVVEGKDGLVSKYAHCDTLLAGVGQKIKKGDLIAKSGDTGTSTGPHLHLEVLKNGNYLNPLFFAESPDDGSENTAGPVIPGNAGEPLGDGSFAALLYEAEKHLGKPYVFGASGPDTFDCSGFICYTLNRSGTASVGRTTAQGLYNLCTPLSRDEAKPGDLIFFTGTYSTPSACSHVGIYVGNGAMIHAGNPVQYASINTRYWKEHFYAFARLP
ncbi:MAG: peptidoglycan DD-metalloendopeptidase family protein [Oscillospiraceae bacterium]|nr:peptidoglycan DD-metalloendopeptidase family protein [Oscillospiraceae bacterium]